MVSKKDKKNNSNMVFIDYPAQLFWRKACLYPSCVCPEKALDCTQTLSFLIKIVRYGGGEGKGVEDTETERVTKLWERQHENGNALEKN